MFRERSTNHIHVSRLVIGVWLMNRFRRKRFMRVSRFTRLHYTSAHTHSLTRGRSHAIVRVPECWCSVIVCGSIGIRRVIGIEPHTLLPLVPFHTDYIDCVSCLFVYTVYTLGIGDLCCCLSCVRWLAGWIATKRMCIHSCNYCWLPTRTLFSPQTQSQSYSHTHACGCGVRYTSEHSQRGTRANKVTYSFRSTAAAIIKPDLHFTGNSL